MENHRTDSIPNDSYPVKSDRLLGCSIDGVIAPVLRRRLTRRRSSLQIVAGLRIATSIIDACSYHPRRAMRAVTGKSHPTSPYSY